MCGSYGILHLRNRDFLFDAEDLPVIQSRSWYCDKDGYLVSTYYYYGRKFGHANIIRYDNRPFENPQKMDEVLIDRWNETVTDEDTVYILGDFSWYQEEKTVEILESLAGRKVLIKGNHDRISPKIARQFVKVCDYLELTDNKTRVILSHYPMPFWNGQFRNSVHLYGHVHNSHQWNVCESLRAELKQLQDIPMRMYNVGCMMEWMDYTPRTLAEILEFDSEK